MILVFIEYYLLGGWYKLRKEQQKLTYMMFETNHDIGMLPGGYLIHYSFCDECKRKEIA